MALPRIQISLRENLDGEPPRAICFESYRIYERAAVRAADPNDGSLTEKLHTHDASVKFT